MGSVHCKYRKTILGFNRLVNDIFIYQTYDYQRLYDSMLKPAFLFDGRKILDHAALSKIGFHVETIGKRPGHSFQVKKDVTTCY